MVSRLENRLTVVMVPRLSIKSKAIRAWEQERPSREAARVERQARELSAVRNKIADILGSEHEVEIGIDSIGRITAVVEDLRFSAHVYAFGAVTVSIFLMERCPSCGEDVPVGNISNLADLGELLHNPQLELKHNCQRGI